MKRYRVIYKVSSGYGGWLEGATIVSAGSQQEALDQFDHPVLATILWAYTPFLCPRCTAGALFEGEDHLECDKCDLTFCLLGWNNSGWVPPPGIKNEFHADPRIARLVELGWDFKIEPVVLQGGGLSFYGVEAWRADGTTPAAQRYSRYLAARRATGPASPDYWIATGKSIEDVATKTVNAVMAKGE